MNIEAIRQLLADQTMLNQEEEKENPNENKIVAQIVRERLTKLVQQEGNFNSMNSELGPSNKPNRPATVYTQALHGGIDIVKGITGLFPNTEFHLKDEGYDGIVRKDSFCGPGTNLNKRLQNFNSQTGTYDKVLTPPNNQLDEGCMSHDIQYSVHKNKKGRHNADRELIAHANKVITNPKSTKKQKFNAGLVKAVMKGKLMLGLGNLIDDQNYLEDRLNKIMREEDYANISSSQTNAGKGQLSSLGQRSAKSLDASHLDIRLSRSDSPSQGREFNQEIEIAERSHASSVNSQQMDREQIRDKLDMMIRNVINEEYEGGCDSCY